MVWMALVFSLAAQAVPYTMNDIGGTLDLPETWSGKSYSDSDLTAELPSKRGKLMFRMWMTPYQVPLNEESAAAFSADYERRLGQIGGKSVTVVSQKPRQVGQHQTLWTVQDFKNKSGADLKAQTAAIVGNGNVVHLRIWSGAQQGKAMRTSLEQMVSAFTLSSPPGTAGDRKVSATAGFETSLPDGWRVPIGRESARVGSIISKLWTSKKGTDPCWVALRPVPVGNPDVMFACSRQWSGGPVDEHSFSSVDEELRELFFRTAAAEIPPAEQIAMGDRVGLMFRPREGVNALRLATAPYDQGLIVIWAQAGSLSGAALDAVVQGVAERTTFTGPDGGQPTIRGDKWLGYYLAHRPTSPLVLGPLLGILGLIGFLFSRRKKGGSKWDDVTEM